MTRCTMAAAWPRLGGGLALALLGACSNHSPPYPPLMDAVQRGDQEFVKQWIRDGHSVDVTYSDYHVDSAIYVENSGGRPRGMTALMVAARSGRPDIVRLLVDGGADVYAVANTADGAEPRTAFDFAADTLQEHLLEEQSVATGPRRSEEDAEIALYLWRRPNHAKLTVKLAANFFALCTAFCNDTSGTDADANPALGVAALVSFKPSLAEGISFAVYRTGGLERAQFLVRHGVSLDRVRPFGVAPRSTASEIAEQVEVSDFVSSHSKTDQADLDTELGLAAHGMQPEWVAHLLARGANPNVRAGFEPGNSMTAAARNCLRLPPPSWAQEPAATMVRNQRTVMDQLQAAGATIDKLPPGFEMMSCCRESPVQDHQARICTMYGFAMGTPDVANLPATPASAQ